MMKIKKSLLSVCLSILFIFGSFVPSISCHAEGLWSILQNYNYFDGHFYKIEKQLDGIIWNIDDLHTDFYDYLVDHSQSLNIQNNDYQNWIGSNMTSDGVEISFSSDIRQALRDWSKTYIEANTGYKYCYSYTGSAYSSVFDTDTSYNSFLSVLQNNQGDIIRVRKFLSNIPDQIWIFDHNYIKLGYLSYVSSYNTYDTNLFYVNNGTASTSIPAEYITVYKLNTTSGLFELDTLDNATYSFLVNSREDPQTAQNFEIGQTFLTSYNLQEYPLYLSIASLENASLGIKDYYITNNYNNSINGSYNTTVNNIDNSITASDVNNYITNYYNDNGHFPSDYEVNVYINVTFPDPDPSPSPSPSPSPDPDPGPGGDDDDNNNIWDWLKDIGDVIGNLIAVLGEVLAGLISAIGSIITSLKNGIPNTIGLFLEWFFPFLPTEIVALIELSILCMVIVGVIRLIRGH